MTEIFFKTHGLLYTTLSFVVNFYSLPLEIFMDQDTQTKIEAAVFRCLLEHLDNRKDVQNIDLMNLAGFCRNCLSKTGYTILVNHCQLYENNCAVVGV